MTSKQLITRSLPVKLNADEVRAKGEHLAQLRKEAGDVKDEAKSVASLHKAKLDSVETAANHLARDIRDRSELRNVTCYEIPEYAANVVRLHREDNGELVETRAMRIEERQSSLDVMLSGGKASTIGEAVEKVVGKREKKSLAVDAAE